MNCKNLETLNEYLQDIADIFEDFSMYRSSIEAENHTPYGKMVYVCDAIENPLLVDMLISYEKLIIDKFIRRKISYMTICWEKKAGKICRDLNDKLRRYNRLTLQYKDKLGVDYLDLYYEN